MQVPRNDKNRNSKSYKSVITIVSSSKLKNARGSKKRGNDRRRPLKRPRRKR